MKIHAIISKHGFGYILEHIDETNYCLFLNEFGSPTCVDFILVAICWRLREADITSQNHCLQIKQFCPSCQQLGRKLVEDEALKCTF